MHDVKAQSDSVQRRVLLREGLEEAALEVGRADAGARVADEDLELGRVRRQDREANVDVTAVRAVRQRPDER